MQTMNVITQAAIEDTAKAAYHMVRDPLQAAADADEDHQAQVRANLVQRRYHLTWDELTEDVKKAWRRIAVKHLVAEGAPELNAPSVDEQIAAYKATLPPSYHWSEPTQWADPGNKKLWPNG